MRPPQKPRRVAPLRLIGAVLHGLAFLWLIAFVAWPERVVAIGLVAVNDRCCIRMEGDPRVYDLRIPRERELIAAEHGVRPRKLLFDWSPAGSTPSVGKAPPIRWVVVPNPQAGTPPAPTRPARMRRLVISLACDDGTAVIHMRDASFAAILPVDTGAPAPPLVPAGRSVIQHMLAALVQHLHAEQSQGRAPLDDTERPDAWLAPDEPR